MNQASLLNCGFAMRTSRYATSRQKACQQCSNSKAKCDRQSSGCTRCRQRGLLCVYRRAGSSEDYTLSSANDEQERPSPVSMSDDLVPSLHEGNTENWNLVLPTPLTSHNSSHTTREHLDDPMPIAPSSRRAAIQAPRVSRLTVLTFRG